MLNLRLNMPADKLEMLYAIVGALQNVPNVVAVVLGGSYASGFARPSSDIDIGIYYREASPFSVAEMRSVAAKFCEVASVPIVTGTYEWGPWVNGGAWIQTSVGKVDFLYRNLDQVQSVIEEGRKGVWRHDYDQQPPYGFRSVVYFGETLICIPLYDPEAEIARLKEFVAQYPRPLKERIVQESLWGAEFSLHFCRTFGDRADVYNASGCMTRVAQFLVHALFALNEQYFVGDKYAPQLLEQFVLRPPTSHIVSQVLYPMSVVRSRSCAGRGNCCVHSGSRPSNSRPEHTSPASISNRFCRTRRNVGGSSTVTVLYNSSQIVDAYHIPVCGTAAHYELQSARTLSSLPPFVAITRFV